MIVKVNRIKRYNISLLPIDCAFSIKYLTLYKHILKQENLAKENGL